MNKSIDSSASKSPEKATEKCHKSENKKATNIETSKSNKRDASGSLGDEQRKNGERRDVKANAPKAGAGKLGNE